METKIIIVILSILTTFPLTHIFMKKGMKLDYNINESREKDLAKFFYIPYLNLIISFFYLLWVIIKFDKPN